SAAMLERHLDWVGRSFRFVSLDELGQILDSDRRPDRPLAAVTFDDGYAEVYEHAFPMMTRKGIPGAVFAVADLVGTPQLMGHDRLYLLLARALARPRCGPAGLTLLLRQQGLPVAALVAARGDAFAVLR